MLECLVRCKFKVMVVSIDGATSEIYRIYRRGGNLDNVLENIRKINYLKQKYNTEFPRLIWKFVIFGHNEHELSAAREMAKKLNMHFSPMLNYYNLRYSPIKDREFVRREIRYASYEEYEDVNKSLYVFPCHQLWLSPQINPNGELLGCCTYSPGLSSFTFGNVFKSGLRGPIRSEKFRYTKKMILGKNPPREDTLCFSCEIYRKLKPSKINPIISFFKILKRFM